MIDEALFAIDQDERDVGMLGGGQRALLAPILDVLAQVALTSHTSRIDESKRGLTTHEASVDRIARGTRNVRDDHTRLTNQSVEERGLADVRTPEHGHTDLVSDALHPCRIRQLGEPFHDQIQEVTTARAVDRRDGNRIAKTELVELQRIRIALPTLSLVGHENDGVALTSENLGNLKVTGHHTCLGIDDKQRHIGLCKRRPRLISDLFRHQRLASKINTTRINETEALAVPLDIDVLAIACHTGLRMHDGIATTRKPVAERRLADVRIADHGDDANQRQLRGDLPLLVRLVVKLVSALFTRPWWLSSAHCPPSVSAGASGGIAYFGRPARSALSANACRRRNSAPICSAPARYALLPRPEIMIGRPNVTLTGVRGASTTLSVPWI